MRFDFYTINLSQLCIEANTKISHNVVEYGKLVQKAVFFSHKLCYDEYVFL